MAGKGKIRLDALLVQRGLAPDLAAARALIMTGKVLVADQRVDKPGALTLETAPVRIKEQGRYVSRAGEKLAQAVQDLHLESALKDAHVLDVGASTGGFTQVCLEFGAKHVWALDVGTNQLAWELRQDQRVTVVEQTDIRDFVPTTAIDFVVADVSFNSLARLAPALRHAAPGAGVHFLLLVKPQFELPRHQIPEGGVVTDDAARQAATQAVAAAFLALGLPHGTALDSRVSGRAGNREIFYYIRAPV